MSSYSISSLQGDMNSNPNPNLTESIGHKVSSYGNSSPQGDINSNPNPNLRECKGHKVSSYNTSSPHGDINSNPNPNLTESKAHKVSSYSNSSTQGDINKQTERPTLKLQRGGLRLAIAEHLVMFIKIEHVSNYSTCTSGHKWKKLANYNF